MSEQAKVWLFGVWGLVAGVLCLATIGRFIGPLWLTLPVPTPLHLYPLVGVITVVFGGAVIALAGVIAHGIGSSLVALGKPKPPPQPRGVGRGPKPC